MVGVAFGVLFAGYTLFVYGLSQVRGCNAGLLDVLWPGRYTGCHPDGPGPGSGPPVTTGTVLGGGKGGAHCPKGYYAVMQPNGKDIICKKGPPPPGSKKCGQWPNPPCQA